MEKEKHKIENLLNKLNDSDREQLALLLIRAGYTVRIDKEIKPGSRTNSYFVEYWKE